MFIYVGCSGGGTSSIFCQKMANEISQQQNLTAVFTDVETVFQQQREYGNAYDLIFVYGGIGAIAHHNAFDFGQLFDMVFVAPQVRFLTAKIKTLLAGFPTIVKDIPMKIFGRMNTKEACALLLDELIVLDEKRAYHSDIVATTKAQDKDIEIMIIGGSSQDSYFQYFFKQWEAQEIFYHVQSYSLESLYHFDIQKEVGLRVLFASSGQLKEADFAKVARRIDGLWLMPAAKLGFEKKLKWFNDYQIPVFQPTFNEVSLKDQAGVTEFLLSASYYTEATKENSIPLYEAPQMKKRKSFLNIFAWE